MLLAAICVATPSLQQRLLALQSGRTTGDGNSVAGATRLFKLLPALTVAARQVCECAKGGGTIMTHPRLSNLLRATHLCAWV